MATPWQDISPKDSFRVQVIKPLTSEDLNVLVNLYEPIIGQHATNLYVFLMNQKAEQLHTTILSTLQIGIREFYQARIRLEGAGLLQTFQLSEESYAYQIEPLLSSNDFFQTDIFSLLLYHQVGEQRHKFLQETMIVEYDTFEGAKNLTRSFLDVYNFKPSDYNLDMIKTTPITEPPSTDVHLDLSDSSFDYAAFVDSMRSQFVKKDSLDNREVKETILLIHEMYGADELDLQKIVQQASDVQSGEVNAKALKNIAYSTYRHRKVKAKDYTDQKRSKPKDLTGLDEQEKAIVQACETLTPNDFFMNIKNSKKATVANSEYYIIENLVKSSQLSTDVINMLIYFILVVEDNNIINDKHINDLASEWNKEGLTNSSEAIKFTKKYPSGKKKTFKQNTNYNPYGKRQKNETLPDWAKTPDTQKDVPAEADDMQAFRERLNKWNQGQKDGE